MSGDTRARADRTPIVEQDPIAIVPAADDESCAFWLINDGGDEFPLRREELETVTSALSRLNEHETDADASSEPLEITCHECGKTWQHAGSTDRATCPSCGATTPVEGIGP